MFQEIAAPYDRLNRAISLGRDRSWRRRLVALSGVGPGDSVADLGTGTGDLAFDFAAAVGPDGRVAALDLTQGMLAIAARKARGRDAGPVTFHRARASGTALPECSFDAVGMGWVLRNVADRRAVYEEVLRILKPGGRFLCLDMSRPRGWLPRLGFWLYRHLVMPVIALCAGGRLSAYRYLAGSTDLFPGRDELGREWEEAGFRDVRAYPLMLGSLCIHVGCRPTTPTWAGP